MPTAAVVPKTMQELAQLEVELVKKTASISATLEIEAAAFRARYAKLAAEHDRSLEELGDVQTQLTSARRVLDVATLPSSLLPWVGTMADALAPRSSAIATALNANRTGAWTSRTLGLPPLSSSQARDAMNEVLKSAASNGWVMVDAPATELTERAVVPYSSSGDGDDATVLFRPTSGDIAVVKSTAVGGRALVAKRGYASSGDLIAVEAPFFSYIVDGQALIASGALQPSLRRSVNESLLAPEGVAAMQAQRWDSRLALGVVALLASWTKIAAAEASSGGAVARRAAAPARDEWSASSEEEDGVDQGVCAGFGNRGESVHRMRKMFFGLACPLQDLDTAALNSLAKFASFVSAALPPTYRVFDTSSEQVAAEHAAMRRGMGEEATLSGHHRLSLAIAKAKERAAEANASQGGLGDPTDSLAFAPYDDNPLHRPVLISPVVGPVMPDKAAAQGDATAPSSEALPAWVRVSIEDVARIMLILQCNAFSDAGTAAAGKLTSLALTATSSDKATPVSVESLHLTWLFAGLEHSCNPNTVVVRHHLLSARSAIESYGRWTGAGAADNAPWCQGPVLFELRALRPIAPGERLSIAYTATHVPRAMRLQRLKRQYYFDCRCDASCGNADTVDWTRAQLSVDQGVLWAPPSALQSGWVPLAAMNEEAARNLPALRDSDEQAMRMARCEAAWSDITSDDVEAEAEALLHVLLIGSDGGRGGEARYVPCAIWHFAVVLRYIRLASLVLAAAAQRDSLPSVDGAVARCTKGILASLRTSLALSGTPRTAHVQCIERLEALLPPSVTLPAPVPALPQHTRYRDAFAVPSSDAVTTTVVTALLDAAGAVLVVLAPEEKRGAVWQALRDVLDLVAPSPHWHALVRCCAAAADPSGSSIPMHLRRL